jgi:uncharacterized protein YigA (DUF484 family)
MTAKLDSDTVALYLQDNAHFFDAYPDLLAGLRLTTQLGGRTVSLQDRQMEIMREKLRILELKHANLMRVAKDNDAIMDKFHQWVDALLISRNAQNLPDTLLQVMRDVFGVEGASLRLWGGANSSTDAWFNKDISDEAKTYAQQLTQPYCGPAGEQEGLNWLDNKVAIQSAAIVALRKPDTKESFGLLVLGSHDPLRFSSELATDFLMRIGQTASAALIGSAT